MALNRGQVNPLNVLGIRKLSFIPAHFTRVSIDRKIDIKALEHWIEYNLNSRYAVVTSTVLNSEKKIISVTEIGVEDPKEITMLTLGYTNLHKI